MLLLGGVHGDEINGVEIVSRIIRKKDQQAKCGYNYLYTSLQYFRVPTHV